MTYALEVLGYCQDITCGFKNVRNTNPLVVADVDVAAVEGSENLLPCLRVLVSMIQE
jgi:hypothetical protein